jgi:small subunit ribosomal protein S22
MPPVLDVREPIERVISVDEQLQDYDSHRHVFVDISISASNKDRYIVVREVDGALREATWDERDRMNQIYYPKTGRKLNMPRMLTGDYLPDVLKNKRHLDVLDLCNVQCEADSPQYIEIHKTVYDDIIENNLYDLLHSTRHFGGLVWYIVRTKKVQGFVENLLKRDMLEDLIAFVDLYHLAYPDEGAEHPENTSQEVTDEERSDHKVNMFLNEIGLKGTVQLKRSTSTS